MVAVTKPKKQDVDLASIKTLAKLPCQKIDIFHSSKTLTMPGSFQVDEELFSSAVNREHHENIELIISCLKSAVVNNFDGDLPTWAGIRALLSNANVPQMHVAFLPFIPRPVTEHSTVYTAMRNFYPFWAKINPREMLCNRLGIILAIYCM